MTPSDAPAPRLEDARDAVRARLIARATSGEGSAMELEALANTLRRLEDLIAVKQITADTAPLLADPVIEAADTLFEAIRAAGVTREHFTGRLEDLRAPLDRLGYALANALGDRHP